MAAIETARFMSLDKEGGPLDRIGTGTGSSVVARTYPTQHFDAQDAYFDPRISSRASSSRFSSRITAAASVSVMSRFLIGRRGGKG